MQIIDPKDEVKKVAEIIQEVKPEIEYWPIEDIPSKYKLYPVGTSILGRQLKVPEVKKLALINENNFNFVINEILKVATKGINIDDLLLGDKIYIIMWLRCNTYREPGYDLSFQCSQCDKDSTYEFTLDKLNIKYIRDDFSYDKLNTTLKNGDNITFKFLTVKDEQIALKFKQTYANSNMKVNDEDILNIANSIITINGKEDSLLNKYGYVNNLKSTEYAYINSYIKQFDIGVRYGVDATCKLCGGVTPVGITFQGDFFIPEYTL